MFQAVHLVLRVHVLSVNTGMDLHALQIPRLPHVLAVSIGMEPHALLPLRQIVHRASIGTVLLAYLPRLLPQAALQGSIGTGLLV